MEINSLRGKQYNTILETLLYNKEKIISTQNSTESFPYFFHKNNSNEKLRTIIPTLLPSETFPLTFMYHLSTKITKTLTDTTINLI